MAASRARGGLLVTWDDPDAYPVTLADGSFTVEAYARAGRGVLR
jgi:hypothetical protein